MTRDLDRLARSCGFVRSYRGLDGKLAGASDVALVALLRTLGIDPENQPRSDGPDPVPPPMEVPDDVACYLPEFLEQGRAWGVTCQLYSLRSARNWGIGDFEDLARLGELAAGWGADFIGVNPLHALFAAEPQWASPFYPADRNFLNPLYIAVDQLNAFEQADAEQSLLEKLRGAELVDYEAVARCKMAALWAIFSRCSGEPDSDFKAFVDDGGNDLERFATFQAISLAMKRSGLGAGWFSWPEEFRHAESDAVTRFSREHPEQIAFQIWLQWQADRQLATVQDRLRRAGMRIGLYLDLAVGTAPDGAATWSDASLTVVGAEIGAPPDMFNPVGQKWGLAPISPSAIMTRDFRPVRRSFESILRHTGALRIDHAMSLYRLFWIPSGFPAQDGAYALYPMADIVRALAEASRNNRALIVGEDLGVVPEGFRREMERARILGYRLFYFERDEDGFIPPERWPRDALACVGSHDTPTLAGWWSGQDIVARQGIGLSADPEQEYERRQSEKEEAIATLLARGLPCSGETYDTATAIGLHQLVARAPSRLMAAQLEDLVGSTEQANIPGTVDEHPNWRRRLAVSIEDLSDHPMLFGIVDAISRERPRQ